MNSLKTILNKIEEPLGQTLADSNWKHNIWTNTNHLEPTWVWPSNYDDLLTSWI